MKLLFFVLTALCSFSSAYGALKCPGQCDPTTYKIGRLATEVVVRKVDLNTLCQTKGQRSVLSRSQYEKLETFCKALSDINKDSLI